MSTPTNGAQVSVARLPTAKRFSEDAERLGLGIGNGMTNRKKRTESPAGTEAGKAKSSIDLGLDDLLGYNLRRAHGVQRQRFAAVFAPYRIRPVQLSILGLIHENPRLKQADLGRRLDVKSANIVTLLDELEWRNLIERRRARTDKRSHVLNLTPAGRKLTVELLDLHGRLEANLAEHLGASDRDQLLRLLKKFRRLQTSPYLDYDE
jgi:DNA-binding MarR family transcriptional regulator